MTRLAKVFSRVDEVFVVVAPVAGGSRGVDHREVGWDNTVVAAEEKAAYMDSVGEMVVVVEVQK